MARTYLLPEHVSWLMENYSTMSNDAIVKTLNQMMSKSNAEKIRNLRIILCDVTQKSVQRSIENEIAWREAFKGVNTSYVKKVAHRLRCRGKSRIIKSNAGQERARATNIIRWKKKAQSVPHPYTWLRTFRRNENRICLVSSTSELNAIRNAIKNFNKYDSVMEGFHFTTEYIKEADILRVKAVANIKGGKNEY